MYIYICIHTHLQGNKDKLAYRDIRKQFPMEDPHRQTISFSSARKRMSTLVAMPDGQLRLFCKVTVQHVLPQTLRYTLCNTLCNTPCDSAIRPATHVHTLAPLSPCPSSHILFGRG